MIEFNEENKAYFILNVPDLPKAKEFYTDLFGWKVLWDYKIAGLPEDVGWAEISLPFDGARLGLGLLREGEVKQGSGQLCFNVQDLEGTKKHIEGKGVQTTDIQDIPDMISMFEMIDPFGHQILFVGEPRVKSESQ
ncbi:MAG: VOC family protein [Candidatus Heimdallarchaeota archaeon]